mmetsp:Transcript_56052/g.65477  ORF Transcript_56052/g.65477 Transcript_56052/m.65477 type:complete len:94 (+) Transcript_56052:419-700(+)
MGPSDSWVVDDCWVNLFGWESIGSGYQLQTVLDQLNPSWQMVERGVLVKKTRKNWNECKNVLRGVHTFLNQNDSPHLFSHAKSSTPKWRTGVE